jgi:hypothetical protein
MDFSEKLTKIHITLTYTNDTKKPKICLLFSWYQKCFFQRTATEVLPFLAAATRSALARLLSPSRVSLRSHNCCMNPALGRIERRDLTTISSRHDTENKEKKKNILAEAQ